MDKNLHQNVKNAFSTMILSASGFRKIFAIEGEEDCMPEISEADKIIAYFAAISYATRASEFLNKKNLSIIIAQDSRPTGRMLCNVIAQAFASHKINFTYLGEIAIPEVLAYIRNTDIFDGFFYVSASHNPVGYNGFKFGYNNGALLNSDECIPIIKLYRNLIANPPTEVRLNHKYPLTVNNELKTACEDTYRKFLIRTAWDGFDVSTHVSLHNNLKHTIAQDKLGVVIDFNGSSRINSIDISYLENLSIKTELINNQIGQFEHEIIPEGESLNQCKRKLEEMVNLKQYFKLGYMPDCDGDRGNLVYYNNKTKKVESLSAQEIFSLCVLSELTYLKLLNIPMQQVAIACNDATSLRVKLIADYFNVKTLVAETGEANIIAIANNNRKQGLIVRILGEGSNGGNITYPCSVRDPLNTLTSIIKLLYLKIEGKSLFHAWQELISHTPSRLFYITEILESIPPFSTTEVTNPKAILKTKLNPKDLKKNFETIFPKYEETIKTCLTVLNAEKYRVFNYEGVNTLEGFGNRTGDETGGFKIIYYNNKHREIASLWFRGSKTEPITRLLVDVASKHTDIETNLLNILHKMLSEADTM